MYKHKINPIARLGIYIQNSPLDTHLLLTNLDKLNSPTSCD